MISALTAKVNNDDGKIVRIPDDAPFFSWNFDEIDFVIADDVGNISSVGFIEQSSFHLMVGTSDSALGTVDFVADLLNTGEVLSTARQFKYNGPQLNRGATYFGQVRIEDDLGNRSNWATFKFIFNSLPVIANVNIKPDSPSLSDSLIISYDYMDADGDPESGTEIRWFKDGKHIREFDNAILIPSSELAYGQTWFAEILPSDGLEFGPKSLSDKVSILTTPPVAKDARILPQQATINDILKADHRLVTQTGKNESSIKWFINEVHQINFDDNEFARFLLKEGDEVRFEITPFDGVSVGETVTSPTTVIQPVNFTVENIMIEGRSNPLDLLTTRPVLTWEVKAPANKIQKHVSILIGTAPGSNNIFSEIITTTRKLFQVPPNLLERGRDYFVSISVNDEPVFENYSISHFRLSGSRWSETVSNDKGWTIESQLSIFGNIEPSVPEEEEAEDTTVAKAIVTSLDDSTGAITEIEVTSGGKNYVTPPTITVTDSKENGEGASLEAKIDSATGVVSDLIIKDGGSGFGSPDDIVIGFSGGQEEPSQDESESDVSEDSSESTLSLPEELRYQVIRFQDGKRFGEVRIHFDKLSFVSDEVIETDKIDLIGNFSIRIHGKEDDVQVFLNKKLVIDATGKYTQSSTSKRLDVGAINGEVFDVRYRTLFYTTSGIFDTDDIDEYGTPNSFAEMQFHTFAEFKDSRAVAIKDFLIGVSDFKLVGVNPSNEEEGGSLYSINPKSLQRFPTANRTFTPINKIDVSENNEFISVAHLRGTSLFSSYPIIFFDHSLELLGENKVLPNKSGWELYQNVGKNAAFFDDSGFVIDTSFENIGVVADPLIL